MEVENAIFQDLDMFGKEMILYTGCGNVLNFCLENCKHILKWM